MDTNKLTKQINTMLRPRAALIAYSTDGGDTYFLEVRSIDNEGAMSEGRPVTVDFINELIKGYSERHSSTPHGRIPTNMLWSDTRKGYEKYIWYNPPQKRMMVFKESRPLSPLRRSQSMTCAKLSSGTWRSPISGLFRRPEVCTAII